MGVRYKCAVKGGGICLFVKDVFVHLHDNFTQFEGLVQNFVGNQHNLVLH